MNLEDKLQEFSKWTMELATSRKDELERELEKEFRDICSTFVKNYKKEELKRYNQEFKKHEEKHKESLNIINKTASSQLFEKRETLLNSLFDEITKDISDFCEQEHYKDYLKENIKNHSELGFGKIVKVALYEKDIKHSDLIKESISYENLEITQIKDNNNQGIGGYMVYFDNNSMLDFTFNARLLELKKHNNFFTIN